MSGCGDSSSGPGKSAGPQLGEGALYTCMRELYRISMRTRMMLMNRTKLLKWRLGGSIVVGAFALLLGSGCATTPKPVEPVTVETLKEACDMAISNPETSGKVLSLLEELLQIMTDRMEYLVTYNQRLNELTSNYATTENEIRSLIEDYNEYRTKGQDQVIKITGQIRELVTPAELENLQGTRNTFIDNLMDGARWL
ncbi:MAG: hypothetical protein DRP71_00520 [Verrucomicrobia bacterium]|nr:MAG: hypothetical protein DRP71_00520 [Verrucomicrobiota bacterium]